MATTRTGIYAAGDVTDRDQYVYMAAYGAKIAVNNAFGLDAMHYDNAAMPWAVFSDPQIAGVGLSEAEAKAAGYEVKTSVVPLDQVPRARAARDTRDLIKLVAERQTDRLLGGQIVAPEGGVRTGQALRTASLCKSPVGRRGHATYSVSSADCICSNRASSDRAFGIRYRAL